MPLSLLAALHPLLPLATAAPHHRALAARIVGIVFVIIGGFTFTFRRALVARNPDAAPRYARTTGPAMSGLFVVVGLVLIIAG